jgi:hypothetical protein
MKRLLLLLPVAIAGCGNPIEAELARCKDGIRAELTALLEQTKRDTAESIKTLEHPTPADHPQASEAVDAVGKFSNETIKAMPDMFAAMAAPMIEAQLEALEPTAAGVSKCQEILDQARQR